VGDDYNGRFIRHEFARDGIDISALFVDPLGSGRSINFMYKDGRRKNFYDGKSHMDLQPDLELCRTILAQSKLAHFSLPNWARLVLPIARELGLPIACDIQDVVSVHDPYRQDFVQYADYLFFSATNYPDPTPLIEAFLAANPQQIVIVGMGAQGCALGRQDGIEFFPAVEIDTPVIDTNGAGDGLAVGFLSSFVLDGYALHESILRGQIVARYTCTQKASSSTLISASKIEHYFARLSP
jgi:sugar/nucleoside kinase (ribokinase family)